MVIYITYKPTLYTITPAIDSKLFLWKFIVMVGILIKAPIIEVQNVVASGEFDQKIDLLHIAASLDRAEYNPESFPGLVLRVSEPKAVFLLFSTGKLVCTGGKSKEDVYAAIETLVKKLRSIDINVNSPPKVKIQNMVASVTLDFSINLETIALTLENSLYEPEQFPGLIYRMAVPKVVILIFGSGKLVCTGAKSEEEVHKAVDILIDELKEIGAAEEPK